MLFYFPCDWVREGHEEELVWGLRRRAWLREPSLCDPDLGIDVCFNHWVLGQGVGRRTLALGSGTLRAAMILSVYYARYMCAGVASSYKAEHDMMGRLSFWS
jgi:hypothetical protein